MERSGIEVFVPMCYRIVESRSGVKSRKFVPAIHNLLFARSTREELQQLKEGVSYLQFRVRPEMGRNVPIVVPDEQMAHFMATCKAENANLRYLLPEEVELDKGTPVRIIGGVLDGALGRLLKVKGSRKKSVVVSIEGLASVAISEVSDGIIEVIRE